MIWEEELGDVEYKYINLTDDLVQVSNSINPFMINIKETNTVTPQIPGVR